VRAAAIAAHPVVFVNKTAVVRVAAAAAGSYSRPRVVGVAAGSLGLAAAGAAMSGPRQKRLGFLCERRR